MRVCAVPYPDSQAEQATEAPEGREGRAGLLTAIAQLEGMVDEMCQRAMSLSWIGVERQPTPVRRERHDFGVAFGIDADRVVVVESLSSGQYRREGLFVHTNICEKSTISLCAVLKAGYLFPVRIPHRSRERLSARGDIGRKTCGIHPDSILLPRCMRTRGYNSGNEM